jgi:geranylgeranyl pyrophosphate synthase
MQPLLHYSFDLTAIETATADYIASRGKRWRSLLTIAASAAGLPP